MYSKNKFACLQRTLCSIFHFIAQTMETFFFTYFPILKIFKLIIIQKEKSTGFTSRDFCLKYSLQNWHFLHKWSFPFCSSINFLCSRKLWFPRLKNIFKSVVVFITTTLCWVFFFNILLKLFINKVLHTTSFKKLNVYIYNRHE